MLINHKQKAYNCIGAGVALGVIGFGLGFTRFADMGPTVSLASLPIFALGGFAYAKAKGQPWPWGFLGLLSLPGILVLMLLKDHYPEGGIAPAKPKPVKKDPDVLDI